MQDVRELRFICYVQPQVGSEFEGFTITPEMSKTLEGAFNVVKKYLECCGITEETAVFKCESCEMVVTLKSEITQMGFTEEEVYYLKRRLEEFSRPTYLEFALEGISFESSRAVFGLHISEE